MRRSDTARGHSQQKSVYGVLPEYMISISIQGGGEMRCCMELPMGKTRKRSILVRAGAEGIPAVRNQEADAYKPS